MNKYHELSNKELIHASFKLRWTRETSVFAVIQTQEDVRSVAKELQLRIEKELRRGLDEGGNGDREMFQRMCDELGRLENDMQENKKIPAHDERRDRQDRSSLRAGYAG